MGTLSECVLAAVNCTREVADGTALTAAAATAGADDAKISVDGAGEIGAGIESIPLNCAATAGVRVDEMILPLGLELLAL